jgi:hypothetical protein
MTLTNAQRAALRRAISASPQWPAYRRANGNLTTADLGSARALEVAAILSIDTASILGTDTMQTAIPTPTAPAGLFDSKPAAALPTDTQAALAALKQLETALLAPKAPAFDPALLASLNARLDVLEAAQSMPRLLVVNNDGAAYGAELPATRHPMLETLLRAVSARDASGLRLNTWITGPAGSGKTYAAKQAAAALGLDFGFHGAMSMAHELLGFVDAGGTYHSTQFVNLFTNGGLCLLDEVDSGSAEALLALNAALANGLISLPNGEIRARHADFVCIAAANTFGQGPDAQYIGRTRLDGAFLSRFPVKLSWTYDLKLEQNICGNVAWAKRVQKARKAAEKAGLKIIIDPRHSMAGAALIAAGMEADEVAGLTYLAGLTAGQVQILEGANNAD